MLSNSFGDSAKVINPHFSALSIASVNSNSINDCSIVMFVMLLC